MRLTEKSFLNFKLDPNCLVKKKLKIVKKRSKIKLNINSILVAQKFSQHLDFRRLDYRLHSTIYMLEKSKKHVMFFQNCFEMHHFINC